MSTGAHDTLDPPTAQARVIGGLLATCIGEIGPPRPPAGGTAVPPAGARPGEATEPAAPTEPVTRERTADERGADEPARDEPAADAAGSAPDETGAAAGEPTGGAHPAGADTGIEEPAPLPLGPVAAALLDLAHRYVERQGGAAPVDVASRYAGVPAPGWLLAAAVVRPLTRTLSADAVQLARAAGVPGHALRHCVAYVEVAAELFAGRSAATAIEAATGEPAPRRTPTPALCGEPHLDALSIGIWALTQPAPLAEVVAELATMAPPAVRAAASGLLGVRDGAGAVPASWQRAVSDAETFPTLASDLLGVRRQAYLQPRPSGRRPLRLPGPGEGPATSPPGRSTPAASSPWSWH